MALRSGIGQECPFLSLLLYIVLEVLASVIRLEKEIKDVQIGKKEVNLSLLTDNMILYVKVCKEPTNKPIRTNK